MNEPDVVVVGGGIGGLAAALHLQRAGARPLLLEGADRPGGVIRTETQDGFVMEAGPDSLLTQKPHAVALCRELGLADRLVPVSAPGGVSVLIAGRLRPMPEGLMLGVPTRAWPMITTPLFTWPGKLRMATEVAARKPRRPADESIAAFFGRHFGAEVVARVGEPLLAGIHAGDPDRLSMSSNFPRFVHQVTHSLDGHGFVVPRTESLPVSAVSFVSSKFPGRAPDGHVLLRAFLGGARDPRVLERDDAELLAQVESALAGLLGLRGSPAVTRVFRWPEGTPQMEVGHAARVAAIDQRVAGWPGLALTGAGLRGTGIPDTIDDATLQAASVAFTRDGAARRASPAPGT